LENVWAEETPERTSGSTVDFVEDQLDTSGAKQGTSTSDSNEAYTWRRRVSLIEQAFKEYHLSKLQDCHKEDGYWLPMSENNQTPVKVKIEELNAFQLDFVPNRLNERRDQIRRISANHPTRIQSNEKKHSVRPQNKSRSLQRDRDGDMIMEAAKPAFDPSKWITKPASFDGSNKKQAKEFLQKTEQYFEMI
jgi:hypothetical protein